MHIVLVKVFERAFKLKIKSTSDFQVLLKKSEVAFMVKHDVVWNSSNVVMSKLLKR